MKRRILFVLALIVFSILHLGCSKASKAPTAPADTNPPGTTSDMAVTVSDASSVTLNWTAPGNDGVSGTATAYEIRYGNTDVVSRTDWSQWTVVSNPPTPHAAGTGESFKVTSLAAASEFVFALRSKDAAGNWSGESNVVVGQTAGFRSGPVLVVSAQDYPYGQYSENGGRTWHNVTVNGQHAKFGCLTVDPANPYTLYATEPAFGQSLIGTGADYVWKSTDHGKTWSVLSRVFASDRDLNGGGCRPVILSPSTPGLMYVSLTGVCDINGNNCCGNCAGQLYKSVNGGTSWTRLGNAPGYQFLPPYKDLPLPYPAMAVDPNDASRIYVGSQYWCFAVSGGTFCYSPYVYSTDGGLTWLGPTTSMHGNSVYSLAINPGATAQLLMSTDNGTFLSENSGLNWTNVSATTGPLAFTYDPSNVQVVYTPVSKSTDGGHTWNPMPTPVGGQVRISVDAVRHELYAIGTTGAYRSADAGATWSQVLTMSNCSSIAVLPDLPTTGFASARRIGGSGRLAVRAEKLITRAR